MRSIAVFFFLPLIVAAPGFREDAPRPNIVLLLADDYGWANLGTHRVGNSTVSLQAKREAHTPYLDGLIEDGILLERHYTYKICSPSRSSLQSGRLAVHVNTVNTAPTVHNETDPVSGYAGIPRNMTGMAEKLLDAGYTTAMVGKWDAGCATPRHTPLGRGYQKWFGYYQHANNYWSKGIDLRSVGEFGVCLNRFTDLSEHNSTYRGGVLSAAALELNCSESQEDDPSCYEPKLFKDKALKIIGNHDTSKGPLFYHHAFHLVHTPLDVPLSYLARADKRVAPAKFDNDGRRRYSAMVEYMDDAVGEIVGKLKDKGMWNNTLVVFIADNGGPIYAPGSGNNHPLKGGKYADWEGGVRTNAFVSGGFVPPERRGGKHEGLISIADWYGMFCELAGVDKSDKSAEAANEWLKVRGLPLLAPVDSVAGVWDAIVSGGDSRKGKTLHLSENAVLEWPYKLITGKQHYSRWTGELYPNCSAGATEPLFTGLKVFNHEMKFSLNTTVQDEILWVEDCGKLGCLFNIETDPNEHNDLAQDPKFKVKRADLQRKLTVLNMALFAPGRGEMSVEACVTGLENGGYYGPFVDSKDWYTGPFPKKTVVQKVKDAAYRKLVSYLSQPEVVERVVNGVQRVIPEALPKIWKSSSTCNNLSRDDMSMGRALGLDTLNVMV